MASLRDDSPTTTTAKSRTVGVDSMRATYVRDVLLVRAAHVLEMIRLGVMDDAAGAAVLRAIDAALMHGSDSASAREVVAGIDERIEGATPQEITGAASLGLTRTETAATAIRMAVRTGATDMSIAVLGLRTLLADLAAAHGVTVMPTMLDGKQAGPTTLSHYLGLVSGELERAGQRLLAALDGVDRSPLGAALGAGEFVGVDREQLGASLGFSGTIENTYDAAGSVEDFAALMDAFAATTAACSRFVNGLAHWIETDAESFFIDERWSIAPEPAQPAHNISARLMALPITLDHAGRASRAAADTLRSLPYGAISSAWDAVFAAMAEADQLTAEGIAETSALLGEALIVNRAWLANRAGRMYATAGDLVPFLIETEHLSPGAARQIAGLAVSRLREQSLEASQITPDVIDSAALMILGQDLKVEMETLGRYLAPRRYLERRDVLGSPARERTAAWLANLNAGISRDKATLKQRRDRWQSSITAIQNQLAASALSVEN